MKFCTALKRKKKDKERKKEWVQHYGTIIEAATMIPAAPSIVPVCVPATLI